MKYWRFYIGLTIFAILALFIWAGKAHAQEAVVKAEGWGGHIVPASHDGLIYLHGVFCNTAEQSKQVFEEYEKKGVPLPALLSMMNKEKVVCTSTYPLRIIVSEMTLLREEGLGDKTAYFYEAEAVGVRTSKSDMFFDKPATIYFYSLDPLRPQDAGEKI